MKDLKRFGLLVAVLFVVILAAVFAVNLMSGDGGDLPFQYGGFDE